MSDIQITTLLKVYHVSDLIPSATCPLANFLILLLAGNSGEENYFSSTLIVFWLRPLYNK